MAGRLSALERFSLNFQAVIDRIMFFLYGGFVIFVIKFIWRNTYDDLKPIREKYLEYFNQSRQPTLMCANHLTMADSFVVNHALAPLHKYAFDFRIFPWNVPAYENYKGSFFFRIMTYLGACIPIDRTASLEKQKHVQEKILYMLRKGYTFTIFPEGTRSRSGQIEPEKVSYGVGQLLKEMENPRVVIAYCRGLKQLHYSNFPARRDHFYVDVDCIYPTTDQKGMRAARDLAMQVILKLKEMEEKCFEKHPHLRPVSQESQRTSFENESA